MEYGLQRGKFSTRVKDDVVDVWSEEGNSLMTWCGNLIRSILRVVGDVDIRMSDVFAQVKVRNCAEVGLGMVERYEVFIRKKGTVPYSAYYQIKHS